MHNRDHQEEQHSNDGDTALLPADSPVATCQWTGCHASYTDLDKLVSHLQKVHIGRKQATYACQWEGCGRYGLAQNSRFAIISHLRGHTGERPFDCPVAECDRSFSRSDALAKHFKVHGLPESELQAALPQELKRKRRHPSQSLRHSERHREGVSSEEADPVGGSEEEEEPLVGMEGLSIQEQYLIEKAVYAKAYEEYCRLRVEEGRARKGVKRLRAEADGLWDALGALDA